MQKLVRELVQLDAPVPPGMYELGVGTLVANCNGVGSDDPSTKWLVAPTTFVFSWMTVASVPHDMWWSHHYNDGTRQNFIRSNDEFRQVLDLKADASFGWAWPKVLRQRLRDARRWEADRAHGILMSDPCWEIWQKNAAVEPGPETQED